MKDVILDDGTVIQKEEIFDPVAEANKNETCFRDMSFSALVASGQPLKMVSCKNKMSADLDSLDLFLEKEVKPNEE